MLKGSSKDKYFEGGRDNVWINCSIGIFVLVGIKFLLSFNPDASQGVYYVVVFQVIDATRYPPYSFALKKWSNMHRYLG